MAQWLRLHTPSAGGAGLIPGRGTKSFVLCGTAKTNKQTNKQTKTQTKKAKQTKTN